MQADLISPPATRDASSNAEHGFNLERNRWMKMWVHKLKALVNIVFS